MLSLIFSLSTDGQDLSLNKKSLLASVEKHKANLISISDSIWQLAETAFEDVERMFKRCFNALKDNSKLATII